MYSDSFCEVYNIFGWNYYPEAFGEQLLLWMNQHHVSLNRCLDLACGTGVLCGLLSEHGYDASGMDFSQGMIRIAKENYPNLSFDVADMIVYRPEKKFDLVTCTGDAINHIHDLNDVGRIFENVYAYLETGGYFIFDILNENEVTTDEPFDLDFSDTVKAVFRLSKGEDLFVTLSTSVFENGEFRFREEIREKIHDPNVICRMLRSVGFEVIKCADQLPDEGSHHGTTWYIIAKKQEQEG